MNALRFSTQQVLTAGSSSSASNAFGANTECIRVVSTIATYIQIAVSPTAAATTAYLPADDIAFAIDVIILITLPPSGTGTKVDPAALMLVILDVKK